MMSSKAKTGGGARPTRKDQIISLFLSGMGEVEDIAVITGARPSYVGSVLRDAGLLTGYFDLYTSTSHPQNIYSKFFANKLGFKDRRRRGRASRPSTASTGSSSWRATAPASTTRSRWP